MNNTKSKIKSGMDGSHSGKSRLDKTEDLKAETKKGGGWRGRKNSKPRLRNVGGWRGKRRVI